MNFYSISKVFAIMVLGIFTVNFAFAQVDPLTDIEFLQTGVLNTPENQFHISNEITIREFFNGNIIRVSGQVIEGFPYITYSKILGDEIDTHGMIFIGGKFIDLNFEEKIIQEEVIIEKNDDLAILVQYTQRIYDKSFALIDVKIYDTEQNRLNDFNQNYGFVPNTHIEILVVDEEDQEFYSTDGVINDKEILEIEFYIPENSKRETLTVTINAENENSKSSKILQIFSLGRAPSDGASSP
jgi:hypothetical protein